MGYGGIIGQTGVSGEYLPLTGGTLTGNLDMSNHGIQNVTSISSSASALIVSNNINVNSHRILNLSQPVNNTDAATKAYVDSKASNWVKAATHSQYDEWHLAVEGGTFVKLVANEQIQATISDPATHGWSAQRVTLDTPTKYNINATNVIKLYLTITSSLQRFSITSAELRPSLKLNFLLYMQYDAGTPITLVVDEGTVIIEYFVPA